jgi:hypothetical protein
MNATQATAAQPTTGDADPGHRIYDAHELHLLLNRIYDLPEVKIDADCHPQSGHG